MNWTYAHQLLGGLARTTMATDLAGNWVARTPSTVRTRICETTYALFQSSLPYMYVFNGTHDCAVLYGVSQFPYGT